MDGSRRRRVKPGVPRPAGIVAAVEAKSTGHFAPRSSPLTRFPPGQGKGRVVATRRKTRAKVRSRCRFVGNHGAVPKARDRKVSRRRTIVPNGREDDIAQGGGAPKLRLSCWAPPLTSHPPLATGATPIRSRAHENLSSKFHVLCRDRRHFGDRARRVVGLQHRERTHRFRGWRFD